MISKKSIFFDLDGTLLNSFPEIKVSLQKSFEKNKVNVNFHLDSKIIGPPLDKILENILVGDQLDKMDRIKQNFFEIYDSKECQKSNLFSNVYEVLEILSKNNNLFIITNKRQKPTLKIVNKHKIKNFFKDIFCLDHNERNFQNKSILLDYIIKNLNLNSKKCILIGDSINDYEASYQNNVEFLYASWGYGDLKKLNVKNLKSFSELLTL